MKIILSDINQNVVRAWQKEIMQHEGTYQGPHGIFVDQNNSIFDVEAEAIVSPANSFGFMDGGIDQEIFNRCGWIELQKLVHERIEKSFNGELLVGQATQIFVSSFCPTSPFCAVIIAPTMRTPRIIVDADAVRLSTRAAVRCAIDLQIESIAITGMGAGSGRVPPSIVADQMFKGIFDVLLPMPFPKSWREAASR